MELPGVAASGLKVARHSRVALLALLLLSLIPSPAQAKWYIGNGWALGDSPAAECTVAFSMAPVPPPGSHYHWDHYDIVSHNSIYSSYYGKYHCNVVAVADPGYTPPNPLSWVMLPSCTAPEVVADAYTTISGCKPSDGAFNPMVRGSSCPTCEAAGANGMAAAGGAGVGTTLGGSQIAYGSAGVSPAMSPSFGRSGGAVTAKVGGGVVDTGSGNTFYQVVDYETAGPNKFGFARFYNSLEDPITSNATSLGGNWRHSYDRYITGAYGSYITAERADGRQIKLAYGGSGNNFYASPAQNAQYAIHRDTVGVNVTYTLFMPDDSYETYTMTTSDTVAKLQSITQRNGYTLTLDRTVANQITVTDSYGRALVLHLSGGILQSITTPDATTISYGYGSGNYQIYYGLAVAASRLSSVTYPDAPGNPVSYSYAGTINGSGYNVDGGGNIISFFQLSGVKDQNSAARQQWTYDKYARGLSTQFYTPASGSNTSTVTYNTTGSRVVTQPSGLTETYSFSYCCSDPVPHVTSIARAATATTPAMTKYFAYDGRGYLNAVMDWNGNKTTYTNNVNGNPTAISEGIVGAGAAMRLSALTYFTTPATVAPYTLMGWGFHLPLTASEGKVGAGAYTRTRSYSYDTHGNKLTEVVNDLSGQVQPSRTWTYTYDATGNVLTAKDPLNNTTTFTWTNGALATVTDALSHVATFSSFTGGGRPQALTDMAGASHAFTYDARQRLATSSVTVSGTARTTTYAWDVLGHLASVTAPDGAKLAYGYTQFEVPDTVTDLAGNVITLTRDNQGNPLSATWKDGVGATKRSASATYDALGRRITATGGAGQARSFTYDNNGEILTATDGLSHTTTFTYDALNRRITSTGALAGTTATTNLNTLDQVTSVVAPGTITTSYINDAFGDVMRETSPDRGTINYTYDNGGNLSSKTDGASAVSNYTYDALNRPLTIAYPADSSLNAAFTYDQTGHGFGVTHLTSLTDQAGSLSLNYDERGSVTASNRTTSSGNMNVAATYDAAGRPATLTYPSGLSVSYSRDSMGNLSSVSYTPSGGSPATLATYSAGYLPFGPLKGAALGNGVTTAYGYDNDYRLTGISDGSAVQSLAYGYDNADNLTAITDSLSAANTQTLGYDVIDRLTSATSGSGGYGTLGYTYDTNGNRLTAVTNGTTATSTYTANSNKLATIGGVAVTHTGAGNISAITLGGTAYGFTYDKANRLATATTPSSSGAYAYDAFGTRIKKTVGATTTLYAAGSGNELLEANAGGAATDTVYANGLPIAQYSGSTLAYLHTDQRATPVKATDGSAATLWNANYDPFGQTTPTGSLTQNIRLPGQVLDAESGLFHNGYRNYVPGLGRDIESDVIGLNGGLNTYGYVGGRPFGAIDPWGLKDIFVGGLDDKATNNVKGYFDDYYKRMHPNAEYYSWSQKKDIENSIKTAADGEPINVIGHSLGGDTAGEVATDIGKEYPSCPNRITTLTTIDPVGSNKNYGEIRDSVDTWIDVNAIGGSSFQLSNLIAGLATVYGGSPWNSGPAGYSTYSTAPVIHADFEKMFDPNRKK